MMRTEHELFMAALDLLDYLCSLGCLNEEDEAKLNDIEQEYDTYYANQY